MCVLEAPDGLHSRVSRLISCRLLRILNTLGLWQPLVGRAKKCSLMFLHCCTMRLSSEHRHWAQGQLCWGFDLGHLLARCAWTCERAPISDHRSARQGFPKFLLFGTWFIWFLTIQEPKECNSGFAMHNDGTMHAHGSRRNSMFEGHVVFFSFSIYILYWYKNILSYNHACSDSCIWCLITCLIHISVIGISRFFMSRTCRDFQVCMSCMKEASSGLYTLL